MTPHGAGEESPAWRPPAYQPTQPGGLMRIQTMDPWEEEKYDADAHGDAPTPLQRVDTYSPTNRSRSPGIMTPPQGFLRPELRRLQTDEIVYGAPGTGAARTLGDNAAPPGPVRQDSEEGFERQSTGPSRSTGSHSGKNPLSYHRSSTGGSS